MINKSGKVTDHEGRIFGLFLKYVGIDGIEQSRGGEPLGRFQGTLVGQVSMEIK